MLVTVCRSSIPLNCFTLQLNLAGSLVVQGFKSPTFIQISVMSISRMHKCTLTQNCFVIVSCYVMVVVVLFTNH
jgi:hypothetical protein